MAQDSQHRDQHQLTEEQLTTLEKAIDKMLEDADSLSTAVHNLVGSASLTWSNPEGAGEYLSTRALLLADRFLRWMERQPRIVKRPTFCRCGGNEAYLLAVDGVEVMIGCVCHTDLVEWAQR